MAYLFSGMYWFCSRFPPVMFGAYLFSQLLAWTSSKAFLHNLVESSTQLNLRLNPKLVGIGLVWSNSVLESWHVIGRRSSRVTGLEPFLPCLVKEDPCWLSLHCSLEAILPWYWAAFILWWVHLAFNLVPGFCILLFAIRFSNQFQIPKHSNWKPNTTKYNL